MENIILGLLQLQPRTIYQLRKRIETGLNLMYSCSTGSIQAAIKKLLQNGYIVVEEKLENGKNKKIYSITDSGKNSFNIWLNSPIDIGAAKNPELSKIYFMGFADKANCIKLIEQYLNDLQKCYFELRTICNDGEILSKEIKNNDIFFYQLQTAMYGRDVMKFNIDWYTQLLKNITGD